MTIIVEIKLILKILRILYNNVLLEEVTLYGGT